MKSQTKGMQGSGDLDQTTAGLDIFARLTQQKKDKIEKKRVKQMEEEKENKVAQSNSKGKKSSIASQLMKQISYEQRQNRGQSKLVFNNGVNKIPGLYNQEGRFEVKVTDLPVKYQLDGPPVEYQFYNLTANARAQAMHEQFEIMEEVLRK